MDDQTMIRGASNRVALRGGAITSSVQDPDTDPSGGGAPGNNMVAIQINQFDGGAGGGDGNLTLKTLPVDGNPANNRVTGFEFDWRNRQVQVNSAQDDYIVNTFDTLDRVVQVDRHAQATGNLIGRAAVNYDDRGRAYQNIRFAVDPATGIVGNALVDNTWYDPSSNVLMRLSAGSSAFSKSVFDALSRQTFAFVGYYAGPIGYAQAVDVTGATIVEQVETSWDEASNNIQTTSRERFHDATGTGPLSQPGGAQPQARVSYAAQYRDAIGRQQAVADYGTNGDVALVRSATIPARSDTVLVTGTLYNDRGEPYQSVDPAATVAQTTLDDAARRVELINNYQPGMPASSDVNVTVQWTLTADDERATMTAVNATTGNQTTTWNYGTTLLTSDVARSDVVSSVVYPDGGAVGYDVNRQSEVKQLTDQNGTVHAFDRDLLGRDVNDRVVTLGSGVDGTVQRIGRTYEVRGMLQNITSYSSPTVGDGAIINDVQRVFNSFEQCTAEYQEHNGAVNTSTSPKVGYEYADGSANTIRQTGLAYPDGRLLTMGYGPAGGIDDALSRVASLIDNDGVTHLVDYTRIGTDTFVQAASPQPQIAWSLINGAGIDPYTGLDQFNRVVDNRWFNTTTSADLDRIQHGYDRAGNRLWRKNTVAEAAGSYLDELYAYDGVYRLKRLDRGQLNGTNSGIVAGTEDFTQAWGLDTTGNWSTFDQADTGGSWTLEQTRTSNTVNEITDISGGGWVVPAYDAAGNMTTTPQPALPTTGFTGIYDAWKRLMSLSAGGSPVGSYLYDGLTRRVSKLVSGALRDIFYTTAWQPIEERAGGSTTPDRQFVCGLRYIDDLVLRDRGTERLYGIQDPNWNMTALVNATGAIQERYSYAAYGLATVLTPTFAVRATSSFDWETLFAAYRWDSESGLYLSRNRYLSSLLGIWTCRDVASVELRMVLDASASALNDYVYAGNRPITATDASGMFAPTPVVVVCAAATAPVWAPCAVVAAGAAGICYEIEEIIAPLSCSSGLDTCVADAVAKAKACSRRSAQTMGLDASQERRCYLKNLLRFQNQCTRAGFACQLTWFGQFTQPRFICQTCSKDIWTCTCKCNVHRIKSAPPGTVCPDRVQADAGGSDRTSACAAACSIARNSTPQGCQAKHCGCHGPNACTRQ